MLLIMSFSYWDISIKFQPMKRPFRSVYFISFSKNTKILVHMVTQAIFTIIWEQDKILRLILPVFSCAILVVKNAVKIVKGCVRYLGAYNSVSAAVLIISCNFQNITRNYLISIPSNIICFSCRSDSVLHVLHAFNPEIIETNTILKKYMYYGGNYSDDVCQCLNTCQIWLKMQDFHRKTQ